MDARAKQNQSPAAQPPTTEERRLICLDCGTQPKWHRNGTECDCPGGGCMENWTPVVEASAYDALARELEEARNALDEIAGFTSERGGWTDYEHRAGKVAGIVHHAARRALAHHPEEGD